VIKMSLTQAGTPVFAGRSAIRKRACMYQFELDRMNASRNHFVIDRATLSHQRMSGCIQPVSVLMKRPPSQGSMMA
jgi:hypothetical protein